MRYVVLMLLLLGCNPGQVAKAAPPTKETIVEALERYDALAAKRDESMAGKVDGLAETVGNNTAELECVKGELKAMRDEFASLKKALTTDTTINIQVPEPIRADAPPKDEDRRLTFHGKPIDPAAWLATSLTQKQRIGIGNRDSAGRTEVENHLRYHGLEGDFGRYSREQLITLHSVAHLKDGLEPVKSAKVLAPPKIAASSTAIVLPQSGGCPNGRCPNAQQSWAWSWSRRR